MTKIAFWNLYKKCEDQHQKQELEIQNGNVWKTYFENLYRKIEIKDLNPDQENIKINFDIFEKNY